MALVSGPARGPLASINVTPLADVMIVLLIIFMVVAPFLEDEPDLDLPAAARARADRPGPDALSLALRRDLSVWLGGTPVAGSAQLREELRRRLDERAQGLRVVWLKADEALPYARVDELLTLCGEAGAEQVALLAEPEAGS